MKRFRLSAEQIRPIAIGYGGCLATDRITVDGRSVGFMYRVLPARETDSGWRFFAGDESYEYLARLDRVAVYDVNTIANYDPSIIALLDSCFGSAFERAENSSGFRQCELPEGAE